MNVEAEIAAEFGEFVHITLGAVAEVEVGALVDFLHVQAAKQDLLGEFARRRHGEIPGEGKDEDRIDAAALNGAELHRERRDQLLGRIGAQNARGMRIEGDEHCCRTQFAGAGNVGAKHVPVRAMDAVKIADTENRGAEIGGNFVEIAVDVHQ